MKQCFNYYEYSHVSVYCQKSTKCEACLGSHRTSKCPQDKEQKYPLYNGAHTSWDKWCEYRKEEFLRIEAAKQSTPRLYKTSSNSTFPRGKSMRVIQLPPKPKQRSQLVNSSSLTQSLRPSALTMGKRGRSSSNDRPPLQITFGNTSRFTAPAKVQIFEWPTTRSQNQDSINSHNL